MVDDLTVLVYARTSTRKQEEARTIETQIDYLRHDPVVTTRFALPPADPILAKLEEKRNNPRLKLGDIEQWYLDDGVSGYKKPLWERPQGKRLLADIGSKYKGQRVVVLVYMFSRLGRQMIDTETAIKEITDAGAFVYDARNRLDIDNKTPVGILTRQILAVMSEFFRNVTVEASWDGMERKARAGELPPNTVRLGYDWSSVTSEGRKAPGADFVVNEEEAKLVRMIFDLDEGSRGISIHHILNQQGYRLPCKQVGQQKRHGRVERLFRHEDVVKILSDSLYTGMVEWGRTTTRSGYTPVSHSHHRPELQIISFDQFNRRQRRREQNKLLPPRSARSAFIYSGLLRCPYCGGPATSLSKHGGPNGGRYICRAYRDYGKAGCKAWTVAEAVVTKAVIPFLVELLESSPICQRVEGQVREKAWEEHEGKAKRLQGQVEAAEAKLKRLEDMTAEGLLTISRARPMILEARAMLEGAQGALEETAMHSARKAEWMAALEEIRQDLKGTLEWMAETNGTALQMFVRQAFSSFTIKRRGRGPHVRSWIGEGDYELRAEVKELLSQNNTLAVDSSLTTHNGLLRRHASSV